MKAHLRSLTLFLEVFLLAFSFPAGAAVKDEWGLITIPQGGAIKIGLGTTLSGAYAKLGLDIKNGVEMAVKDKGSILGFQIELRVEDDQCEGAPSVAVAEKFGADPGIVGVVGYMCSGGSIPASDVHNKYKKVMISPSSTADALTARGVPVVFRTAWNDKIQGKAAAQFALRTLKVKKAAVVHDKSAYGQGLADEFRVHFEKGGGKIVAYEGIARGEKDFTPVLAKIKPREPELIYFGGMAAEGALLVRQMKEVGLRSAFMSDDGCYDVKDFIEASGGAAEGSYVTFAKSPEGAKYAEWKKRYEAQYGPLGAFSAQGYDAAMILLSAIEKVAKMKPDGSLLIGKKALADAIRTLKYEGVTGRLSFDHRGDVVGAIVVVNRVEGKRFVALK